MIAWLDDNRSSTTMGTLYIRRVSSAYVTGAAPVVYSYNAPPPRVVPSIPEINRRASIQAHADLVVRSRARPSGITTRARHGFAQLAPLPCYRAVRTR